MPEDVRVSEGLADTLAAAGNVTAPGAGAAIATLAAPPAGAYEIRVSLERGGAASVAADIGNFAIKKGATTLVAAAQAGADIVLERVTLDGASAVTVNAVGAATAGVVYSASIRATRVA